MSTVSACIVHNITGRGRQLHLLWVCELHEAVDCIIAALPARSALAFNHEVRAERSNFADVRDVGSSRPSTDKETRCGT